MKSSFLLLTVACFVAGAGAGVVVGFGVWGSGSGDGDLILSQPDAPKSTAGGGATGPAPETGETAGPPAAGDGDAGGKPSPFQDAIRSVPLTDVGTGEGRITGRVETPDGAPVAGVVVRAGPVFSREDRSPRWRKGDGPPPERDLEAEIRKLIRQHKFGKAARREAVTNADGSYVLAGLGDGKYWIQAFKKGFEISPTGSKRSRKFKAGDTVNFKAKPLVGIPVDVFLPDGSEPEEADIRIGEGRSWNRVTWRPGSPSIRLMPGSYTLTCTSGDEDEYRSESQDVTVGSGKTPNLITFRLKGDTGIKGKVILPAGMKLDHVWVWALRCPSGRVPKADELVQEGESTYASSYNDYAYSYQKLPPGTYLVGASYQRRKAVVTKTVEVTDHRVTADLSIPHPEASDYVILRVFGPKGEPLTNLKIETGYRSGRGGTASGGGTAIRKKDGSFLVLHHPEEEWNRPNEGAQYFITASSKKFGRKEVAYKRGEVSELKIQFGEPATLEVTVDGYVGSEYEGKIHLVLEPKSEGKPASRRHYPHFYDPEKKKIDAEGRITLGPTEVGAYDLVMYMKKSQHETAPVQRIPVTLVVGKNQASIPIPALYDLTVVVEKAPAGTSVQLRRAGESMEHSDHKQTDKEGRATFKKLSAGEYKITVWGAGVQGTMDVTLPGPPVVTFEPKPINALQVTIDDPEGYLAKAGFQTGDLVIGIDGQEFKDVQQMQLLFMGAMSKESVKMTVERGGSTFELKLDPKKLFGNEGNMGGDFEPASRD
ncbi:MAG: carboxypeptidase-like regulatory domain-containing protein [Planctomycetota bacterium]|jgi:hypothetical protein